MYTGQSEVTVCGWVVKADNGSFHVWINVTCGWQVKLRDPSLTRAQ